MNGSDREAYRGPFKEDDMQPTTAGDRKWNRVVLIFFPLWMAFMVFMNVLGDSRLKEIRSSDIIKLIGFGACLGIWIVSLADLIRSKFRKGQS